MEGGSTPAVLLVSAPGAMCDTTASTKHALRSLATRWLSLSAEIDGHDEALDTITQTAAAACIPRLQTGCPNRLFAVVCRMKGSVGEPHSDQRDRPIGDWTSDGLVRGHHLWTAVRIETRCPCCRDAYAAIGRALRIGSYVVSCFHIAYNTCANLRAR